jgi:hypothetical protein
LPTSTGTPPDAVTKADSASAFELTIWCGPIDLVSGGQDRDPRPPMHEKPGPVHRCGEADVARRQAARRSQQHLAFGEVEPGAADVAAARRALADFNPVAAALGVLLDHDGIGAVGQWRAGKDAGGLAGSETAAKSGAGRDFGDDAQRDGNSAEIVGARRVSVHRGDCKGRLRAARRDVLGENAADRVCQRHLFRRYRGERRQQPRQGLFDRDHQLASYSPDFPPDLRSNRKSVTTMPRSIALHMS